MRRDSSEVQVKRIGLIADYLLDFLSILLPQILLLAVALEEAPRRVNLNLFKAIAAFSQRVHSRSCTLSEGFRKDFVSISLLPGGVYEITEALLGTKIKDVVGAPQATARF